VAEDVAAVEDQPGVLEGPGQTPGLAWGDGEGAAGGAVAVEVAAGGGSELHLAFVVELGGAVTEGELVGELAGVGDREGTRRPARTMIASGR
jgi:hypothetical protein